MKVEMTGVDDLQGRWKVAVCGFPGSGKTMLASTAEDPLMVFFSENPKIKSIAKRFIPHVKISNRERPDGSYVTVQDQLMSLIVSLSVGDHPYKTLILDTGDELQLALKEARRWRNSGEFGLSDWGWLSDTYREIMFAVLALDIDVVVNFHIKNSSDDQGSTYRELLLQGSSKDEVAGWFDEVWVIEPFEVSDDSGQIVTRRNLLSHASKLYPWLKDHSGIMPSRYPISDGFVGDLAKLFEQLRVGEVLEGQERQVIDEIPDVQQSEGSSGEEVPSPERLADKKAERAQGQNKEVAGKRKKKEPAVDEQNVPASASPVTQPDDTEPADDAPGGESDGAPISPDDGSPQGEPQPEDTQPEASEQVDAEELVKEELGATEVPPEEIFTCEVCGVYVDDEDLRELTQIRFRKYLCRNDFKQALKNV